MADEERRAHALLGRAAAVADSYGVGISVRIVRARQAAGAIVHLALETDTEMLVIGAPRKERAARGLPALGTTVEHVLKKAPCRIMLIEAPPAAANAVQHAA
jgi:nucleotide-binding universal stress UspA family protein